MIFTFPFSDVGSKLLPVTPVPEKTKVPPEGVAETKVVKFTRPPAWHRVTAEVGTVIDAALTTATALVALLQPVEVSVKVKLAVPVVTPVTSPPFVTVATAELLLTQVPPVVGLNVMVEPRHNDDEGAFTVGSALMVIKLVVLLQLVTVFV